MFLWGSPVFPVLRKAVLFCKGLPAASLPFFGKGMVFSLATDDKSD